MVNVMSEISIEVRDVRKSPFRIKTVGRHARKVGAETFVSPRLVLSPDFNSFIGREYIVFHGKAKITFKVPDLEETLRLVKQEEGEAIVLLFP